MWQFNAFGWKSPLKRLPSEYFRDNFVVTTSGMNYSVLSKRPSRFSALTRCCSRLTIRWKTRSRWWKKLSASICRNCKEKILRDQCATGIQVAVATRTSLLT
jgi:hypothetical protein